MREKRIRKVGMAVIALLVLAMYAGLKNEQDRKWEQFYECSKDQGDMGCDSCYYLIFNKHVDTYSLFIK